MRAVTWQGRRKVSVDTVPDPVIKEPTDAIIRVTSTNICGSDLHLYEVLGAFMSPGDILGHEAMGVVEEIGGDVKDLTAGDRVVIPFNICCGHCFMCDLGLQSQCETTQVHVGRRLRGRGEPDAADPDVRQADQPAHGPSERPALGRRDHASGMRR